MAEEVEVYGCCALDDERGSGHDGPCEWVCSTCNGSGRCPECNGVIEDDLDWCELCENNGCPGGCYEGRVQEDVMLS